MTGKNFTVGEKKQVFNILSHALSHCVKKDLSEDFDRLFKQVKTRNDIVQVLQTCLDIDDTKYLGKVLSLPVLTFQDKVFVLKRAINENRVECLKIFLAQPSLGITPNVDFLSFPITKHFNEVVRLLIEDNRVSINTSDKIAFKTAKSSGNNEALELLLGSKQNISKEKLDGKLSSFKHKLKKLPDPNQVSNPVLEKSLSLSENKLSSSLVVMKPRSVPKKDLPVSIKLPFGSIFNINVKSQFRTCDLYKLLEDRCSYQFIVLDNELNLIEPENDLVTELVALEKDPTINVIYVFEVKNHEPFGEECLKIHHPDLLNQNPQDVKLASILEKYPLNVDELHKMSESFNCVGIRKEFIKQKKGEIPDFEFMNEELDNGEINEIVESFFEGENKPNALGVLFSLKEFDVEFLEKLAIAAIEKDFPGVLRSCGNHCLWRGTSAENFVLEAVEKGSADILDVLLSLPDVNPAADDSISAIAAHALDKKCHLDILMRDSRVKIYENNPLIHATRYGMTDYVGLLI